MYADGVRVRKLTVKGGRTEERVYVGGVEEFRKVVGSDIFDEEKVEELTFTEHAPGGLTLDTKLRRDRKGVAKPKAVYRYALGNHLGSTSLEVEEAGGVVSYEEYHPYGTTAYRAVRSGIDVDVNRYRFTGMERDEETGLAQHGARYYVSWLGRWMSADPVGLGGGLNRFAYCRGDPVGYTDRDGTKEKGLGDWLGEKWDAATDVAEDPQAAPASAGGAIASAASSVASDPVGAYRSHLDATLGRMYRFYEGKFVTVGTAIGEVGGEIGLAQEEREYLRATQGFAAGENFWARQLGAVAVGMHEAALDEGVAAIDDVVEGTIAVGGVATGIRAGDAKAALNAYGEAVVRAHRTATRVAGVVEGVAAVRGLAKMAGRCPRPRPAWRGRGQSTRRSGERAK